MRKFKKGELVVCLKDYDSQFTKGKVYTVRSDQVGGEAVSIKMDDMGSTTNGHNESYFARLTIHNAPVTPEKPKTILGTQVGGSHYTDCAIQPIEYIWANKLGFSEGNIIKYVTRWRAKGGIKDLEKAKHHIALLIEHEQAKLNVL